METLSDQQLKTGYWYVTHKILLKNIFVVFLFISNLVVWGYIVFSLVFALGVEVRVDQQILRDLSTDQYVNLAGIRELTSPKDLMQIGIITLPSFGGRIDILGRVKNPNEKWAATFNYRYMTNAGTSQTYQGFIMPAQEKYLFDLDVEAGEVTSLEISNVKYVRELGYEVIKSERERFIISDVAFIKRGEDGATAADRATFVINNSSNFNYYRPSFQILLLGGGRITGAQTITLEQLLSGQSYPVDIRWFENIGDVITVEVIPDINYLTPSSYLPF